MKNKAFVFTGIAFLMIIPSIILAASFASMQRTGDTAIVTKIYSDRVFYAFSNIETNFEITGKSLVTNYACAEDFIRDYLTGTWGPYIEQDLAEQLGVTISFPEDEINVSYDASEEIVKVGHLNVDQGIPVNITDIDGNIRIDKLISPINISTTIGPAYYCVDADGDGYNGSGGCNCGGPVDCNDTDSEIHTGADERCNGLDDDCDTSTNENSTIGMNVSYPPQACGTFSVNASYKWDCNVDSSATLYYSFSDTGPWTEWGLMDDLINRSQKIYFESITLFLDSVEVWYNVTFDDDDGILANQSIVSSNQEVYEKTEYESTCCPKETRSSIVPICKTECQADNGKDNGRYNITFNVTLRDWNGDLIDADSVTANTPAGSPVEYISTGVYIYRGALTGGDCRFPGQDYSYSVDIDTGCFETFTLTNSVIPNKVDDECAILGL